MKKDDNKELKQIFREDIVKFNSNTIILFLIIVEFICFGIWLVLDMVRPKLELDYSVSDFYYEAFPNVSLENSELVFYSADGISDEQKQMVPSNLFSLKPGAYQFMVSYDSDVDGTGDFTKSAGEITVFSMNHEIETCVVNLDDSNHQHAGRFWIPPLSDCHDMYLAVQYNGQGTLRIRNIKITEYRGYRMISWVGALLVVLLLDVFLILFFSDWNWIVSKKYAFVIGIFVLSCIPFVGKYLYAFDHDLWFHLRRITLIASEFSNGQFPVRISTEANNGYGYVNSLYYCDIFMYLPAILYQWGAKLRTCYQFYVITVNVFTGVFTYYAMSKFTKKDELRLLGVALYMFGAYRLTNVMIRAAVGEYTAMAFLPLVIAGIYNIIKSEECKLADWFPLSFGMAGLIMSHVVTVEMLIIVIVMLGILLLPGLLKPGKILAILKATIVTVLMTAWFVIPFIDSVINQKTLVQTEDFRDMGWSTQSWMSLFEIFVPGNNGDNYESLGLSYVVGIVIILYVLYIWKGNSNDSAFEKNNSINAFRIITLFAFVSILLVSTDFPWDQIQNFLGVDKLGYQLGTIQFSWRFLAFSAICISVSCIIALDYIGDHKKQIYKTCLITMSACILFGCAFFYYKVCDSWKEYIASDDYSYATGDSLYYLESTDRTVIKFSTCVVSEGDAYVDGYEKTDGIATLHIRNNSQEYDARVSVPIFAYNNYHIYEIKNNNIIRELQNVKDDKNRIMITVPAGFDGDVIVKFVEPTAWRISEIVSLLTWITVVCYTIYILRNKTKRTSDKINLCENE